jgi:hypothetical protein
MVNPSINRANIDEVTLTDLRELTKIRMKSLSRRNHAGPVSVNALPISSRRRSAADRAPDLFADLVENQPSLRQHRAQGLEVMDHAVVTGVFDGNP